jgi:MFS transporter, BCD family, chlorophyll transporter
MPKLKLPTMFRLGLFQMGLGIMSLLTLGVLNRIMIDELNVLPFIAAGAIAMHQFVSPARIWFGQMSDAKPLFGYHRSGYVWLGAALFTTISFVALQIIWQLGGSLQATGWSGITWTWAIALGIVFAIYGLALSASSTPFAALLVDVSDDDNRSKLIGIVWSMLMVGIVIGAIISSRLLDTPELCGEAIATYDPTQDQQIVNIAQLQSAINPVFLMMPALVFGLCLFATFGVEKKYSRYGERSIVVNREDQVTFKTALKVLTANRQTGLFFTFLIVLTLSIFMQDTILEPYGGVVFGMCISETTQLNAFFGMGTLLGISSSGFLVIPRLGEKQTTRLGCLGAVVCFMLIILSGLLTNPGLFKGSLFAFGLMSGLITAGATNLMLDLTAAETAGTFIGAWGLAQAIARGLATLLGGIVLSIGKIIFTIPALAYGTVFTVQALGMLLSIYCLGMVNIQEFQDNNKKAMAAAIESELE